MAKKTKKVEVEEPQVQEETVVIEQPKQKIETPSKPKWEVKNRTYYLKNRQKPLSYMIRSCNVYYFDEEKGYERELKYCQNQKTCFVDEMKGDQRLEHIIFRSGVLMVEKEKTVLQKLLSIYHPHKDVVYTEWKPEVIAETEVDTLELEVDALLAARNLDIDMAEAVMRVELGSKVSKMSSQELKRDLLIYAKRNPVLFLELVNDENVILRNFGIKATELGILSLSSDQRYFSWGSNGRKLMTVPFEEHPYSALAQWFKTDEGMEIYSNIEKRLK
jgi:5-methylcytosine-specific restriction endonuclease McrA